MKKFFGVLFLIVGLFMLIGGVQFLSSVKTNQQSVEGQIGETVSHEYRSHNDERQIAGMALLGGGILFIIIGIIMVASKSNSQRKKEAEYEVMKRMQTNANSNSHFSEDKIAHLSNRVKECYLKKDYYSAISAVRQIIEITPDDSKKYIDLACLLSLTQNLESYTALEKAILLGYSNFEKVNGDPNLDWLRKQPDYEKFVANGYKKVDVDNSKTEPSMEKQDKKGSSLNEDVIQKLEKLAELKDRGILTDEEFQIEKKKLLSI